MLHCSLRAARFVAVALGMLGSACGGAEARLEGHLSRGMEYFAQENYEKARVEFGNALQIAPNHAEARFMSGRVAERLGNIRDAARSYQGAIDVDPQHVRARANLGRIFVFGGAPERAMEIIEPVMATAPNDAELLTVRAAARMQLQDRDGALADAERAVQLDPTDESAVALLASMYRQSDPGKAIGLVQQALTKMPGSVDLRQVLAELFLANGDEAGAEAQLKQIVTLRPDVNAYRYHLALLYTRARKLDAAEKVLTDAVRDDRDSVELRLAHAEFVAAHVSPIRGAAVLREYVARDPENFDLRLGLGAVQERGQRTAEAIATYEAIAAVDEGQPGLTARSRIAAIHLREGRFDEATKLADDVLKENPRDNDALMLRGNIALERRDLATAIADLRAVLRDQPDAVPVMLALARAHALNGEGALAEETLRKVLEAAPDNLTARVQLAQILSGTERSAAAVALLEDAVRAAPQDVAAREALVRSYIAGDEIDAARTAAEDLKTLQPERPSGHYLAGVIAQAQNRPKDAETNFLSALQLQPGAPDTLAALVRLYMSAGQTVEAMALIDGAIARDPKNIFARNLRGEIHLSAGRFDDAKSEFGRIVADAPAWPLAHRNLALAHFAAGDEKAGIAAYQAGVKATNHDEQLTATLASLYEERGQPDLAIELYETLYARNSRSEVVANNLAMLLVTYRTDPQSLDRSRDLTAAFANSTNAALLDTYGWVRFKRGELSDALSALKRASELAPQARVVRYHLAMAQVKAGELADAEANLETALADTGANFIGIDEARSALKALKNSRAG
jgi:tetratricopeptide (TPR) repeat protein